MDRSKKLALLSVLVRRRKVKKRERKLWVHPLLENRHERSSFFVLFPELRNDEAKFFNYFRMSISSFDELAHRLYPQLKKQNTNMRNCIEPPEMLAVTLRYLASGCTFTELHYAYRLGISTATNVVRQVCSVIWSVLMDEYIPAITQQSCESTATGFEERANFPHCIGAVDGKHIRIIKPEHSGSLYHNYKGYFSIILMAVADSAYRFIYVDIGAYGGTCDSTVFKKCSLWQAITQNSLQLPTEKPLPGTEIPSIPYFLIGDEGFGLHHNLLRPFAGNELSEKKKIFNYRLTRARRYVECSFGILANKWRILHRPLNVSVDFGVDIVKACVVLHNFVREKDGVIAEMGVNDPPSSSSTVSIHQGMADLPISSTAQGGQRANFVRNAVADYFLSESGSVPWQFSKI